MVNEPVSTDSVNVLKYWKWNLIIMSYFIYFSVFSHVWIIQGFRRSCITTCSCNETLKILWLSVISVRMLRRLILLSEYETCKYLFEIYKCQTTEIVFAIPIFAVPFHNIKSHINCYLWAFAFQKSLWRFYRDYRSETDISVWILFKNQCLYIYKLKSDFHWSSLNLIVWMSISK